MSANDKLAATFGPGRTTPTPTLETRIAEVLAASDKAHQFKKAEQMDTDYPHFWCSCGVQTIGRGKFPEHVRQASAAALAPVIAEHVKGERADVLLDSASNLESSLGAQMTMTAQTIIGSLRTRAMIERGNPDGSNDE